MALARRLVGFVVVVEVSAVTEGSFATAAEGVAGESHPINTVAHDRTPTIAPVRTYNEHRVAHMGRLFLHKVRIVIDTGRRTGEYSRRPDGRQSSRPGGETRVAWSSAASPCLFCCQVPCPRLFAWACAIA